MVGHNASGYRSVKYGQTRDHVAALKILLADGTAVDAHDVPVDGAEWRELVGRAGGLERIWREIADHREDIVASRRPVRQNSCGYVLVGFVESDDGGAVTIAILF